MTTEFETHGAGTLFIVGTPIGNLEDLTARARKTLEQVDCVAAEDTRHTRRLLEAIGVDTPMVALHEHNEREKTGAVLDRLRRGESLALVSDAGTPLISDPGYVLVRAARDAGIRVCPIPGPCAFVTALSGAGLPTDRFSFEGFLPGKRKARDDRLRELASETQTLVFYEAPHRMLETLKSVVASMGADREVVVARELTKAFETYYTGAAGRVLEQVEADPYGAKGEFVVMIAGNRETRREALDLDPDDLLRMLVRELPVKKAARIVSELSGVPKNQLYQRALDLRE